MSYFFASFAVSTKKIKDHKVQWFKGEKGDTSCPLEEEGRVVGMVSEMTDRTTFKLSKAGLADGRNFPAAPRRRRGRRAAA